MVLVTPHIVDPIRANTPVPPSPKLVVPFMDPDKFDKQVPENKDVQKAPSSPSTK
jgi:hypothetical protein